MCLISNSKEIEAYARRDLEEKLPKLLELMATMEILTAKDLARPDLPKCFTCGSEVRQKGIQGGEIYCPKCGRKF